MKITESSENIFNDIYPDDPVLAAELRTRADLMIQIEKLIKRRGLTQARAAKLFGVSQPRVSDLMRGKFQQFNAEALIEMLRRAGLDVKITTTVARARRAGFAPKARSLM